MNQDKSIADNIVYSQAPGGQQGTPEGHQPKRMDKKDEYWQGPRKAGRLAHKMRVRIL